jgi:hypothetical protein
MCIYVYIIYGRIILKWIFKKWDGGTWRFILREPVRYVCICIYNIWEDNIKMDFQEVGWRNMDWIDLSIGMSGWLL